jgi:hypothetical protein
VIRKRTPSAGPLSSGQLSTQQIPIGAESGVRTKTPSQVPVASAAPAPAKVEPVAPSGRKPTGAMPSIALRSLGDHLDELELTRSGGATSLAMPAIEHDAMGDLAFDGRLESHRPGEPAKPAARPPASASKPADDNPTPAALRGKVRYAVISAHLTSAGIQVQREDGSKQLIEWELIVGIIARRLPSDAPYDSITFVDLVSTAGATVRIMPWTAIIGAPVYGEGEERARAFVQLVAAHCLDAKLDSWTKVFADGSGHAAQLASAKMLAAHDERLA